MWFFPSSLICIYDTKGRERAVYNKVFSYFHSKTPLYFFFLFCVYLCYCIHSFLANNGCTQKITEYCYSISLRVPPAQLLHFTVRSLKPKEVNLLVQKSPKEFVRTKYEIGIQISGLQVECSFR